MLHVDSSALLKHYIREAGSQIFSARIKEETLTHPIFMSVVGYAEVLGVFARRVRESLLSIQEFDLVQEGFLDDWMFSMSHVELTVAVLGLISDLVKKHPLKGSDAIHLASALSLRDAIQLGKQSAPGSQSLSFATSDKQLKRAAIAEDLSVFDPEAAN